jgi:hypothetical protein
LTSLKTLVVIGTRPEAIKPAAVIKELKMHAEQVRCKVCAITLHREMLEEANNYTEAALELVPQEVCSQLQPMHVGSPRCHKRKTDPENTKALSRGS